MNRAILWLVFCLTVPSMAQVQSLTAEEEASYRRSVQRQMIDADISIAEEQKTTGLLLAGGGLAIQLISIAAFFPGYELKTDSAGNLQTKRTGNPGLFYGGMAVGSVVEIWGIWKWADGFVTANQLKMKRYDYGLIQKGGHTYVAFQHTF